MSAQRLLILLAICAMPVGALQLNDTGIQFCGGATSGNYTSCSAADPVGQDKQYGRDANPPIKVGGGHAGFDFTNVPTSCVYDNVTGLTWEIKTDSSDNTFLRDKDHTYTWYDGSIGAVGDSYSCNNTLGSVALTPCNTKNYIDRINSTALCGYSDWRLPTRHELETIIDLDYLNPVVDSTYFPNTVGTVWGTGYYWTSSRHANGTDAWKIDFASGNVYSHPLNDGAYAVRLVRGTWQ